MKLDDIEKLIAGCAETLENYDREYTEGMEHQRGYSYAKSMYNELRAAKRVMPKLLKVAMRARDVRIFALTLPDDVDRGDADELLDAALADLEQP